MKKVVVLILVSLFFGCNKKEDSEIQKPYVISREEREFKARIENDNVPYVIIPVGISLESNLVIDEQSNIYYYQRTRSIGFGNDYRMENDSLPRFLNLQPKDLIKIPKDCIDKFIDENVMTKEKRRQILIIASQTDTIKDHKIVSFFYNLEVPTYVIRRTTQEEDSVLSYKKKDIFYDSKKIKWDKSRIKFPNQVKFTKP